MSTTGEFKRQEPKPNPGKPEGSVWFIPFREHCHLCKSFGRKPIYKNLFQLYYHYVHKHGSELEIEWRARIEQLLTQVREK